MSEEPIDRTKLKCFRDINNINQTKKSGITHRPRTPQLPPVLLMRRIPEPDPFQIPDAQLPPPFHILKCFRTKSTNIRGKRQIFQLIDSDGRILFSAKVKPRGGDGLIYISVGNEIHIKAQHEYVMLHTNTFCDFSLRRSERHGEELLSILFRHMDDAPRTMSLTFFAIPEGLPSKLSSCKPELNDDMEWTIDLHSTDAMSSIKNTKLVDDENRPMSYIRKTESSILEVESHCDISAIYMFAMAISSFLCKI